MFSNQLFFILNGKACEALLLALVAIFVIFVSMAIVLQKFDLFSIFVVMFLISMYFIPFCAARTAEAEMLCVKYALLVHHNCSISIVQDSSSLHVFETAVFSAFSQKRSL
jgi:hypothetical protein